MEHNNKKNNNLYLYTGMPVIILQERLAKLGVLFMEHRSLSRDLVDVHKIMREPETFPRVKVTQTTGHSFKMLKEMCCATVQMLLLITLKMVRAGMCCQGCWWMQIHLNCFI